MKTPNYDPAGEITAIEQKQAGKRAFQNLEKAKQREAELIQKGKRYKKINNKTYILK